MRSTLTAVCEAAVKLVGVDHSGLVLFDEDNQWGTVVAEYPDLPVPAIGERIQVGGVPPEERLAKTGEPLIVNDVRGRMSLGSVRDLLIRLGVESLIVVPIVVDGVIRGSFSFDAMGKARSFQTEEIEKCKNLAQFASVVVKNAYLLRDLEALGDAVRAITSEDDDKRLIKAIMRQAVTLLMAKGGGIHEYDESRRELRIIDADNPPEEIVGRTIPLGEGMAGRLIESGDEYISIPDYSVWKGKSRAFDGKGAFSVLGVPLVWKEKHIGVLWVHNRPGHVFLNNEIDLLKRFAITASIAIDRSHLNKSARFRAERLQKLATATNKIITQLGINIRDEILTLVAEQAHRLINAEASAIFLVQEEKQLTLVASHGHRPGGFPRGKTFKIQTGEATGLTSHIAYIGETFKMCGKELIEHPAAASRTDNYTFSGKCHSLLAIPLKKDTGRGSELVGLLKINNKKGRDGKPDSWTCFTDDDQSIAEIFAQAAMVAIETANLFDQINRERAKYQSLLNAHNILGAESLDLGLEQLAQMLVTDLRKSFCRILLSKENPEFLHVIAAAKQRCAEKEFRWNAHKGETTCVSKWPRLSDALDKGTTGVLEYKNDLDRESLQLLAQWIDIRNHAGDEVNINSLLLIPLKIDDRLVGLLTVGELRNREDEGFTAEQVEFALAISADASVLIEKNLRERRRERRRLLYERLEKAIQVMRSDAATEKILLAIVREAAAIFSAEISFLMIERPNRQWVKLIDSTGAEGDLEEYFHLAEVGPGVRKIVDAGDPVIINQSSAVQADISSLGYELKTLLAMPVSFTASKFILFVGDSSLDSDLCKDDLDILERLGQQGALSLSKALISEQLTRARDGAHRIAEAMTLGKFWDALNEVVEGIWRVIDCGAVTLYRFEPRRNRFVFPPAMAGVWNTAAEHLQELSEDAPTWKILRLGQLHVTEDTPHDDTMNCAFVGSEKIESSAGIPLIVNQEGEERRIGVMFVNYRERHHFSEEDKKNIKLFAHEAAVVIHNMELYEGLNEERARLKALYETERALNSSAGLKTISGVIAHQVFDLTSSNGRRITVANITLREDNLVRLVAGYPEEPLSQIRNYVSGSFNLQGSEGGRVGLVGKVILSGEPMIVNNTVGHQDFIDLVPGTRSQLVVPIKNDEGVTIGAVSVESPDVNTFNEHDQEVIETLARQASVAVTKDEQRRISSNAKAIALVGAAHTIWGHSSTGLAQLILSEVKRLEQIRAAINTEVAAEYLRSIRDKAEVIIRNPSTVPLSAEEGLTTQLLNPMIEQRINDRLEALDDINISTELSGTWGRSVRVSEGWFGHAFNLILNNAVRAAGNILVKTEMREATHCLITVSNSGPPIPDDIWQKLGNEPINNKDAASGLGIGILLADMILGVYGGKWVKLYNEEGRVAMGIIMPVSGD